MEARQYMRQLVEQCMMQFFVAVKARESGQLFLKVSQSTPTTQVKGLFVLNSCLTNVPPVYPRAHTGLPLSATAA